MARFVRATENRRWDFIDQAGPDVTPEDYPAALLSDLKPSLTNQLSVWVVEEGRGNLPRIVAAVAASKEVIRPWDCILFDGDLLVGIDVSAKKSRGVMRLNPKRASREKVR